MFFGLLSDGCDHISRIGPDGQPLPQATLAARRLRETKWKDQAAWEANVVKPYLEAYNCTQEEWLAIISRRCQVIMDTNSDMQTQLAEHEVVLQSLRKELSAKKQEWEVVQGDLSKGKERQAQAEEQLRELREARMAEEVHLRDKTVALHQQLMSLTQSQRRLEDQRRDDERRAAKNKELVDELKFMKAKLELRKAEFEIADEFESQHDGSEVERDAESEAGTLPPPEDGLANALDASALTRESLASMGGAPFSLRPMSQFDDGPALLPQRGTTSLAAASSSATPPRPSSRLSDTTNLHGDATPSSSPLRPAAPATPRDGRGRPQSSSQRSWGGDSRAESG